MTELESFSVSVFIGRDFKKNKFNGCNFLEFIPVQEIMWASLTAAQCDSILLRNETFDLEDPPQPVMHPRAEEIKMKNPELYNRLCEKYRKLLYEYIRVRSCVEAMRDRFVEKQKIIHKTLVEYLGPSVLSVIQDFLRGKQYFEAWHALDEYYLRDGDIFAKMTLVEGILTTLVYDAGTRLPDFMDFLKMLFRAVNKLSGDENIKGPTSSSLNWELLVWVGRLSSKLKLFWFVAMSSCVHVLQQLSLGERRKREKVSPTARRSNAFKRSWRLVVFAGTANLLTTSVVT